MFVWATILGIVQPYSYEIVAREAMVQLHIRVALGSVLTHLVGLGKITFSNFGELLPVPVGLL